jgi:aromatic-L-amino-acid/L-tryptophan decarboxylase
MVALRLRFPRRTDDLRGLTLADSVAVDPHKWLYATNYVDYGPQNSRGFCALKVWLALKHVGAAGYRNMIAEDIRLSQAMAQAVSRHEELQLITQELSITTFRYVPGNLRAKLRESEVTLHLDALNRELVDRLQRGGETFVSNAVVDGHYVLRACIVNFHTTRADVEAVPDIVARIGREVEAELRLTNSQPE